MGECKCGKCICEDKYTWPDCSEKNCDHSSVKAECLDSEGKNPTIPCNGHGECTCGTCACLVDEYHGPFCNFAWYPQLSCIDFKNCVEEDYFKKPIPSVCDQKIEHVEDLEQTPFNPIVQFGWIRVEYLINHLLHRRINYQK
ncbi:hypothetical protein HZS_3944 [Henneguya salminicola]|nr:hypothetical protein HZS_3944 [Henneguya salminicola]